MTPRIEWPLSVPATCLIIMLVVLSPIDARNKYALFEGAGLALFVAAGLVTVVFNWLPPQLRTFTTEHLVFSALNGFVSLLVLSAVAVLATNLGV